MINKSRFRDAYSHVFQLPGLKFFVGIVLVFSLVFWFLVLRRGVVFSGFFLFLGSIAPWLVFLVPVDRRVFDFRRISFFVVFGLFLGILYLLGLPGVLVFVGLNVLAFILFLAFVVALDVPIFVSLLFLWVSYLLFSLGLFAYSGLLPSLFMFVFVVGLAYYTFVRDSADIYGRSVRTIYFLRAYLFAILRGRGDLMESIFDGTSVMRDAYFALLLFREADSGSPLFGILGAQVHPGPIPNVGSSELPYELFDRSSRDFVPLIYLKGPGTHDMNLPTRRDTENLIEKIIGRARSVNSFVDTISFCESEYGSIKAYAFGSESTSIVAVTSHPEPTDDLDATIGYFGARTCPNKRFFVVDMHNSLPSAKIGLEIGPDKPQFSDILDVLSSVCVREFRTERIVRVGMSRVRCREVSPKDGLGRLGVVVVFLETDSRKVAFVVFDSNNIHPDFTARVIRKFSGFVDRTYVFSTDTHSVCGVSASAMYEVLGNKKPDIIMDCAKKALLDAISRARPAVMSTLFYKERVRVMGSEGFAVLSNMVGYGVKLIRKLFLLSILLIGLLSFIAFYYPAVLGFLVSRFGFLRVRF